MREALAIQPGTESSLGCRAMAESNAVHTRRPTMRRATAAAAERIYREKFGAADGSVPATFEARIAFGVCTITAASALESAMCLQEV